MNILIYYPYNARTVALQSEMEMLVHHGHKVVLLTSCERGWLHDYIGKHGVVTESVENKTHSKIRFYLFNLRQLISALRRHRIDVVIAHQQIPALIAGILRKGGKFGLIYVRHNSDEDYQGYPVKAWLLNKMANCLTPVKVAPSSVVQKFWIDVEKARPSQINRINYGYDFQQYEQPVEVEVEKIRNTYRANLLILSMARLVPAKRHREMFSVIARLVKEGADVKMICLGGGRLEKELRRLVNAMSLQKHVFLLGRKENIFDYIQAADVFMHLSSTEASNSAVKEAGLCRKPIIICRGVGDFEDYVVHGQNGFLVARDAPDEEAYGILSAIAKNQVDTVNIGAALYKTVTQSFHINNIAADYERILQDVMGSKPIFKDAL